MDHGVSGWLIKDPWDPDQIAEGLLALVHAPSLRTAMGSAARSTIEKYTWDRAADETLAVYEEVVAGNESLPDKKSKRSPVFPKALAAD